MFKKLISTLLVTVLLVSSATAAFAAKKQEDGAVKNICELWGDFETDAAVKTVAELAGIGEPFKLYEEGAEGSDGSLWYQEEKLANYDDMKIYFAGAEGETYDFSFYVKTLTTGFKNVSLIINRETGYNQVTIPLSDSNDWQKISYTYTVPANNASGKAGGYVKGMQIRFNGTFPLQVLFDKFSIVPHGNVPDFDYSSVNDRYKPDGDKKKEEKVETGLVETVDVNFADVTGHWAEMVIESLAKFDYVDGMGDGTFSPNSNVTRAQFIKMAADLYNVKYPEYAGDFNDVKGDEWYAQYLYFADKLGLIDVALKFGGNIQPDKAITREEAASIAAKVAKDRGAIAKEGVKTSFKDDSQVSAWAKASVKEAASLGMILGYEDGTYKPGKNITRAEAAQILFRMVEAGSRMHIYVDAAIGDDENDGTSAAPLKTITAARDMAAKYAPKMQNDITIFIRGEQYLSSTFKLDENNSGKNGYKIVYTSWGEEKATITMAKKFKNFTLHDAKKNIWKVFTGPINTRQAYFNDVKGIRARTLGYLKDWEFIDHKYYLCSNEELLDIPHPEDMDAIYHILWQSGRYKVKSIGKENGKIRIDLNDRFLGSRAEYITTSEGMARSTPSYLENAYIFLDQKGEWFLDKHEGFMYYIPRDGEDMSNMECKVPVGEGLVFGSGSNYKNSLENVTFDNLIFEGETNLIVDRLGSWYAIQNNLSNYGGGTTDASAGAGLKFQKCKNISLTNNVFRQMGMNGVEFYDGSKYINVIGNEFYDLSATSIIFDDIKDGGFHSDRISDAWCEYITVANNYIHDVGRDYHGAAGASWGWPRHSKFTHNEVANTPYSGTHSGWGWETYNKKGSIMYDFETSYNYVHDVMTNRVNDGAGMYFIGAGSYENDATPEAANNGANKNRIINNYVTNGWQCDLVYPDQGSRFWYVANNVTDIGPYRNENEHNFDRGVSPRSSAYWCHMWTNTIYWMTFENNYSTVDFAYKQGHMNQQESSVEPVKIYPDGNWPEEARAIIAEAGIEPEYRDNFDLTGPKTFICNDRWQDLQVGEPTFSGCMVLGDYNTQFPLTDFDLEFWIDDPEAVTMDENGYLTAHKEGIFEAEVVTVVDGISQAQHMMLECYDGISGVNLSTDAINSVKDTEISLSIQASTSIGKSFNITGNEGLVVDIKSMDESVATIGLNDRGNAYIFKAVDRGNTTLVGSISYQGKTYEINVPVDIMSYSSKEAESLPYREVNLTTGSWMNNKGSKVDGGGLAVVASPAHLVNQTFNNELIAFDMVIVDGSGWPSLAFCDNDFMGNYSTNDCYMIGFKKAYIEFQRWNKGSRSMIFGDGNALGGPGVPNNGAIFEHGKRYSIIMGALDTEEGTRIILTINGENIIDYTDKSSSRIAANGYLVSYNPSPGSTTFYPFTGITNEPEEE